MVWDKISTGSIAVVFTTAGLCFSTYFIFYGKGQKRATTNIPELGGFSLLTAWPFFAQRNDFLWANFKKTGANIFRFRVLQQCWRQWFLKQILALFTKDRMTDVFPSLLRDTTRLMAGWGSEGTINPFDELNAIVFQLTVRMSSCQELANDQKAVARMSELIDVIEKNATPASLLLPWFPSPTRRSRQGATRELFAMMGAYVERRRAASFSLRLINAEYINTGMNVCWNLLYLGMHPDWKDKVAAEIQMLVSNHTNSISNELDERLASIPLNAWGTELPVTDCIIRETLRMMMGASLLRRNLDEDVVVDDRVIPQGDFLIYPLADVHANPDIYPDPFKFDPERFDPGREEDKKVPLAFLGWGAGEWPGPLIMALFFLTFEFEVVDSSGEFPKSLPRADFNEFKRTGPPQDNPCYIKFKRIVA
ncbi:cytochrome P450 [Mycena rosella]|uniref:Cytochrome P450 n=1 Tax=Mycena rosella TaxID=1033263 RepID=A0AAD7G483_MYCRO|nr:cytochrome P450 [Mycena rosella]